MHDEEKHCIWEVFFYNHGILFCPHSRCFRTLPPIGDHTFEVFTRKRDKGVYSPIGSREEEDRGSIHIDTSWQFVCWLVATGRDPASAKICWGLNSLSKPIVPSFRSGLLSIHLCSNFFLLLDGPTREQNRRKKKLRYSSHPPALHYTICLCISSHPPTNYCEQKPPSPSLSCHRGAAVSRPMDRFMVRPGTPLLPSTPQAPQTRRPNFTLL